MSFDLLNPDDEVMVEFLCTGNPLLPTLTARIEGIKKLAIIDPTETKYRQEATSGGCVIGIFIVGAVVMASLRYVEDWLLEDWLSSLSIPDSSRRVIVWFFVVLITLAGVIFLWLTVVGPVFKWVRYRASRGRE